MRITKTLVLCSASAAILSAAAAPTWAQTSPQTAPVQAQEEPASPDAAAPQQDDAVEGQTPEDDGEVEGVVVTGLRRSLQSAQSIRRNSDQIVDSIVAEDIGKLPDVTASDSLARVTGVQVERGGGEAGRVLVRGLPDITTTYNGRDIFTAEARFVAVQDFPAGGVAALEVYKSTTANLIEGGIAGLINVRSRRPFDFQGAEVAGSVRGTYAYQSRSVDPNWNLLLSNRWDTARGRFGALVNLSYTQLNYLDSARFNGGFIATAGAGQVTNPAQAGFRFPDGVGVFQGQGDRSRPSANAAFQWRPNDKLEIYADALYQGFRNRGEDRILFVPLFGGGIQFSNVVLRGANAAGQQQAQSLTATGAVRPDGFQGAADGDTDTYQFGVGAIYNMGPWRFSTDLATTDSVFELSVFSYDYAFASSPVRDVNFDVGEDGGVLFNFRNFDSTNPANYIFRGFFDRRLRAAGDDIQWRGDARFDTGSSLIPDVEFGVRYTDRNGQFDNGDRYAPQEGRRLPLTVTPVSLTLNPEGFRGGDGAQLPRFVVPTRDSVREGVGDLRRLVGFAEGHPPFDPVQAFTANEKAYAAYAQLSYEFDGGIPIDGSIGLRAVKTEISVTGTSRIVGPAGVTFQAANAESEYTDYLPSVTARFRFTDQLQGRLAANKTRTRPGFADYNPGLQVDPPPAPPGPNDPPGTRPRTARGGNIDLQPIESENYDAALEYYFSPTGSATVTAFRRDVDGFIVRQRERVTDPVLGLLEIDRPVNLNATKLQGVEAAFTTFFDFDFVPMWARGFGVQLNGTYIDHDGSINGISETSYNVVGMYEQGPLSARLAYNARSEFTNVLEIGGGNPGREYTEDVSRLDFSSSYTPRENITVTFDVSNILGKPFRNFREYRDQSNRALGVYPRDVRYEETIYSLGLRFRL